MRTDRRSESRSAPVGANARSTDQERRFRDKPVECLDSDGLTLRCRCERARTGAPEIPHPAVCFRKREAGELRKSCSQGCGDPFSQRGSRRFKSSHLHQRTPRSEAIWEACGTLDKWLGRATGARSSGPFGRRDVSFGLSARNAEVTLTPRRAGLRTRLQGRHRGAFRCHLDHL